MHGRPTRTGALIRGLMLVVTCAVAGLAPGQTAAPEEYAARAARRVALLDLRARINPTADDYLVADHVLAAAHAFTPENTELLRARISAAWSAGDSDRVEMLTRELLGLDPGDTVAQLRLISSRIAGMQTVEERIAAYSRFLGPAGESIDPSVRSRLALDAALLCRETGDFDGFAERLARAVQLDVSNKEAAALAWSSIGPLVESRSERVELLLNLLMADPTDPHVYRQIALELAISGAFEQAQRFHDTTLSLYMQQGAPPMEQLALESLIIGWQVDGPEAVVDSLNRRLAVQRSQAAAAIRQYEQARVPTDSLPRPEDVRLPPRYNRVRLVAAITIGDQDTIKATVNDIGRAFAETIEQVNQAAQIATPEELAREWEAVWGSVAEQLSVVAWAGEQTEALNQWADSAAKGLGENAVPVKMLRGWYELRYGDPEAAAAHFRAVRDDAPLNRVGLGLALDATGRADEALGEYQALAAELPLTLSGVWARAKCLEMGGPDPLATADRAAIIRLAGQVPEWVFRMTREPRSFMQLHAELISTTLGATQAPALRVRLTNIAPIPLAVGGDRPINGRLLLAPRLQIGVNDEHRGAQPEVLELNSRLRLLPTESIEVTVLPDAGFLGMLAEIGALETVRQRWRVLQGYQLDGQGVPRAGLLCLETETGRLDRMPLTLGRASAIELADALDTASESELPDVLAAVRARAVLVPENPLAITVDDRARIAAIAADRYPALSPVGRAMMLGVLPTARMAPGMEAFDAAALDEQDPLLVPLALVTRVADADHPAVARWIDNAELGAFARALRARLESNLATYSRLDAASLRPRGGGLR